MIKTKVYGTPIWFYVNPIYPNRHILYYNHEYYDIDNNPTPMSMYYFIQDIRTGNNLMKHHTLDEYNDDDLRYIINKLGIKSYKYERRLKKA